jgi:hypothetical protein
MIGFLVARKVFRMFCICCAADLAVATRMLKSSAGGYLLPDAYSRYVTNNGFTWGDNPGDAINIMNGWDHAETVYGN